MKVGACEVTIPIDAMKILEVPIGRIPPDPVAPDSLRGVSRQQTNPRRWQGEGWNGFRDALRQEGVDVREARASNAVYVTDAGGLAHGMPTGTLIPRGAGEIATVLRRAQQFEVPVTVRGGGLTTEGESVAFGGLLLDMSGMSRVLEVDPEQMTVRTEAGIYWLQLAEQLRR
ncbi:MAG: FAD-dependent oxidoreductase, partial [Planctomycetota bacterium]|nr:FAD-dependent oxidoreductase [Planctomycetota bacterium]